MGAIWFGFGVLLWRASGRRRTEPTLFRGLAGILVLSGVVRLPAATLHGSPGALLMAAMIVEIGGGLGLLIS